MCLLLSVMGACCDVAVIYLKTGKSTKAVCTRFIARFIVRRSAVLEI